MNDPRVNPWRTAAHVSRWFLLGVTVVSFGCWLLSPFVAVERRHGVTLPSSAVVLSHWEEYPEAWGEAEIIMDAHELPKLTGQLKPCANKSVVKMAGIAPGEWQKMADGERTYACASQDGDYLIVKVGPSRNGRARVHLSTGD